MTLPTNFNKWTHLLSIIRSVHNKRVRLEFIDVGGEDWNKDITSPRASIRTACTIDDDDNALIVLVRMMFFWFNLKFLSELVEPFYGVPIEEYQSNVKFKPQITLHFKEDEEDLDPEYRALRMRISFRLVNETSGTIAKAKLKIIAEKINIKFNTGNGYRFHKGKYLFTYKDTENGYDLQIYAYSKGEAKELITDILFCNGDIPSWKHLKTHEDEEPTANYPTIPGTQLILGERLREPRKRPVGWVRFQFAECKINGRTKPLILVDRTYRFNEDLIRTN